MANLKNLLLLFSITVFIPTTRGYCDFLHDYQNFITGYALGLQQNFTNNGSDCTVAATSIATVIGKYVTGFMYPNRNDIFRPIIIFNQILVELSDALVACSNDTFINQFKLRTTSFSGLFNLLFTLIYELYVNKTLIQAIDYLKSSPDCLHTGYQIGVIQTDIFDYLVVHNNVLQAEIQVYSDPSQYFHPTIDDTVIVSTPASI